MATVVVIAEDGVIVVDGETRNSDSYAFADNLWAIQWDGTSGHAEWTDGENTELVASDVDTYISMWTANTDAAEVPETPPTGQEIINNDNLHYLSSTDWYVVRNAETGVAIPSDILTARANARAAIVE